MMRNNLLFSYITKNIIILRFIFCFTLLVTHLKFDILFEFMPPKPSVSKTQTVKVVVRCRPLSKREVEAGHQVIVHVNESNGRISVDNPNPEKGNMPATRDFTYDAVFAPDCKQSSVFEETALPIIQSVLEGYNGTIFAYGQTGTGKTFTMEGVNDNPQLQGIVPRSIHYIFEAIKNAATTKKYLVRTSFLELYNEQLVDLLVNPSKDNKDPNVKKKKLEIREKPNQGIKVDGLLEFVIQNEKQITNKYNAGKSHRVVAFTQMNAESSRSHSILSIIIENQEEVNGKLSTRVGKLNLVDLAGSERQDKTNVTGLQLQQAININLSLSTLGLVIKSLVDSKSKHIPYRDSQLTRLLQDSLGGNTKTVMIANVGPSAYNYEQTLSTLKYANSAKNIKNDVRINQDPKDALLRQFQEEIKKLREQVAKNMPVGEPGQVIEHIVQEQDAEEMQEKLRIQTQTMKKKFQQEKAEIYKKKNMLQEQKKGLLNAIEEKQKEMISYKNNQENLIKKLKKMEQKVLTGKEQQEAALKKAEELKRKLQEVEQKRQKQRKIEQDLKKKQDSIDNMNKIYKNLQEQNEDKSLQIKQKLKRLKNLQNENKELEEQYAAEIEDLQERRRILQKELKLKNFIIDYFVPAEYIEMINEKVVFNESTDEWVLPNLEISGNSLRLKNPGVKFDEKEMTEEMLEEMKINEFVKNQLESHPNTYFAYSEDGGIMREVQQDPTKVKKTKKRPQSKKK